MKRFLKISGIFVTIIITVLYLVSSLTPYISPDRFPAGILFSIAFLFLLFIYVVLLIAWLFVRKRIALVLFILAFAGWENFTASFASNVFHSTDTKDSGSVKLMCWNVRSFGTPYKNFDSASNPRSGILAMISQEKPDILCLQDFLHVEEGTTKNTFHDNITAVMKAGGFSYYHYPFYYEHNGTNYSVKSGVIIFSRLPVIDTASFSSEGSIPGKRAGYVDILVGEKPLRIYAAHFSSMQLWPNVKEAAGMRYLEGDSTKLRTATILSKLCHYSKVHAHEANVVKNEMSKSPYPFLFSADLNSVPSGYVYHTLKKGLKDAFLENGFGIGGTYNMVFPKPRIDVLLHSSNILVTHYKRPAVNFSDHFPIIADIRWKK